MELKIYNPQEDGFLEKIEWNFEELKTEITEKAGEYVNLVYTDDQIKEAKKDRATLNKFKTALNDKKKEVKKQVMDPYTTFEAQIKELIGIVDKAVDNIDQQVKSYEQNLKEEKRKKIEEIYKECIGDLDRTVPLEKIFKESWLNVTTTQKSIREEITEIYERVDKELKLINMDMSPFVYEMKEEYLRTFDLAAAQAVKQQLEETARKKAAIAEQERKKKEEQEKQLAKEAKTVMDAGTDPVEQALPKLVITEEGPSVVYENPKEKTISVTFRVTARESQFPLLNDAIKQLKANSERVEMLERKEL